MNEPRSIALPYYAEDFLVYFETILGKSQNTAKEYYYDLLMFFRFVKVRRRLVSSDTLFDEIEVADLGVDIIDSIRLTDLYAFLNYINADRKDKSSTRARKVACLRSFFKYCYNKANLIKQNPADELESPKAQKRLPKYLDLSESHDLLDSIDGPYKERDYCIVTLFLNCGMRLSELVGINIQDVRSNTLTVIGKGNKERTIYLNNACLTALSSYLSKRHNISEKSGISPLFLSNRDKRISPKTVEHLVKKYLLKAGLDVQKYSVHKLRHTAATLMYTYGDVDIRALQEILGHESVATTQIYTHINEKHLREAVDNNPLANYNAKSKDENSDN